jgi:sacsin
MDALQVLFDSDSPKLSAHVCFMANQVAEKALRAGMYALIGLQPLDLMHHDLRGFAEKIEAKSNATGLKEATAFLNHYLDTRYPNRYGPPHKVPANEYEREDAVQAKRHAEKLLQDIRPLVLQNYRQY